MNQKLHQKLVKLRSLPKKDPNVGMIEEERQLMLRVMDGHIHLGPVMFHIHCAVRRLEILKWLVAHNITGQELHQFVFVENKGSILGTMERILRDIERRHSARAIFAGRDLIFND